MKWFLLSILKLSFISLKSTSLLSFVSSEAFIAPQFVWPSINKWLIFRWSTAYSIDFITVGSTATFPATLIIKSSPIDLLNIYSGITLESEQVNTAIFGDCFFINFYRNL